MSQIKVLQIRSLAYSGSTWATLVLASHPQALALGGGDRVFRLARKQAAEACMVHGAACPFWPDFLRDYDRGSPMLPQLAAYSGRRIFVINNPGHGLAAQELANPDVDVVTVKLLRDGRATTHSWMRHHSQYYEAFYDAVRAWLYPAWKRLHELDVGEASPWPVIRYEDMARDWRSAVRVVGERLGIEYPDDAVRYWQHGHHLPSGNTGALDLLRRLEGGEGLSHHRQSWYDRLLQDTLEDPDHPVLDESWRESLTAVDLAAYDFVAGELHAAFGYPREGLSDDAVRAFRERHSPPGTVEEAVDQIEPFARLRDRNLAQQRGLRGLIRRARHWLRS